jgi:mono/diheme cytochrome c family protein
MTVRRFLLPLTAALVASIPPAHAGDSPALPRTIDYVADVRPILTKTCYSCHGPDKQRGGLRLDQKAAAFKGGDSGAAIVPGKAAESLLVRYVAGLDPMTKMPPKGELLSSAQVAILRTWVDQGAKWPDTAGDSPEAVWWSLRPLAKPHLPRPSAEDAKWARTPIDAFVIARLREKGLHPAPEADRRTLIRRLSFDLTGLPPTPEEVSAFVGDPAPDAYEKLVDRLLSSPAYGERWCRHWLDVVHYGDTHGYDKDKPRPNAWPYRDYVVRSFNGDKPYSRFVEEQLAGDVLYPGTPDGIEALGFISAGPWDFIGHAEVPETKSDGKVARHLDRDDMLANTIGTFLSLTVHCAQCHNHKFDPISQEDYYSLQAVFAAVDRTDRLYDADPITARRRADLEARRKSVDARKAGLLAKAARRAGPKFADLDAKIAAAEAPAAGKPELAAAFGYHSGIMPGAEMVKWVQVDLKKPMALSAVVLHPCHDDFNNIGDGFGFPQRFKVELSDDPEFKKGVVVIADRTAADVPNPGLERQSFPAGGRSGRYVRVTATKLAPRQNDYIFALAELEALDDSGKNVAVGATVTALDSIEAPPRWRKANLVDGYYPGTGRLDRAELTRLRDERARLIADSLSDADRKALADADRDLTAVAREVAVLPPQRVVYVGAVHTGSGAFRGTGPDGGKPRPIHVLPRGDVNKPGKEVGPGALSVFPELPSRFRLPPDHAEGERRAALARYLTDPKNALTWRSIVNRVWRYHFGRGIVESPNDFGRMGQLPTHPELLDWLAAEFRDNGQSLKALHRMMVTSATYRQTSSVSPTPGPSPTRGEGSKTSPPSPLVGEGGWGGEGGKLDADNAYYWRMNRRKLEAEAVRDATLAAAGRLDRRMGGPGFQDFVVEKPEHSPHYEYDKHDADDPRSHRRAVYRFLVRSQQEPFMVALDCADPSMRVDRRNEGLSALQALALLNNDFITTMARHFAERLQREGGDVRAQVNRGVYLALGRPATDGEADALTQYARKYGLANVCRVLFNLNEFVFVD